MKQIIRNIALGAIALATAACATLVQAQAWPSAKPIRMIVPLAPGGGTDIAARIVAQYLGEALGQQVVIDNKVGANGVIGVNEAARAPADGYTLVVGSSTTMAANNFLYKNPTVEPLKDFAPLAMLGTIDFALMVPASSTINSVKELIAVARASPGRLSYGFGTSAALLCGEMFNAAAGVNIVKVPYKGSPQSLTDLAGERLQLVCDPLGTSMPLIKGGKLRALAVTSALRNGLAKDVPTMAEAGLPLEHETWAGFFAPAKTPKEIVQRLSTELVKIMSLPDVQAKIIQTGFIPRQYGSEEFATIHRADYAKMEKMIKAAGISPE